jgi:hypothetical protein
MNRKTEQEIYTFMGRTADAIENINKRLDALPCDKQIQKIDVLEDRVSKVEGKITTISAVSGFVGSVLFAIANWFLTKIKL